MLLVIDIGNTNIVIGIYDKDRLAPDRVNRGLGHNLRIGTKKSRTADEYGIMLMDLFNFAIPPIPPPFFKGGGGGGGWGGYHFLPGAPLFNTHPLCIKKD